MRTFVAVHLLLKHAKDGRVLMMRRRGGWCSGRWALPAGHTNAFESLEDAAAREVQEELGLVIPSRNFRVLHALHRPSLGQKPRMYVDFFLEATNWHGTPKNEEPDKCSGLQFCALDELADLPDPVVPHVRHALHQCAQGKSFTTNFGWGNDSRGL